MSLRVCFVASEVTPFAKTGGLGDVSAALTAFLHRQGHDVRPFLPLYASLERRGLEVYPVDFVGKKPLRLGDHHVLEYSLYTGRLQESEPWIYFVHCPQLYGRASIYTADWDEALRFAFLTRAAIESCQHMGWSPDILHVNDWHTALGPLYLESQYHWDRLFERTRSVLTLHNLGYQGIVSADLAGDLGLANQTSLLHQEDLRAGRLSFLKSGILYASALTTVSRTYAEEIQTPAHGAGLEDLLRARRGALHGIVNGIDTNEWSPESDRRIPHPFSAEDLSGKERNKQHLLEILELPYQRGVPLLGMVSRLTAQKGIELFFDTLPAFLSEQPLQLVALGAGEPRFQDFLTWLQHSFPRQVCYHKGYSDELAHLIEAGADLFLMPSQYEPCGLNQMYSQRYGTVPIVRRTGGLADTVEQYEAGADRGTGFVFDHFTPAGFGWALDYALRTYRDDNEGWLRLMRRGMAKDFSWDRQGLEYVRLYEQLLGRAPAAEPT